MWMEQLVRGIGVIFVVMRMKSFERGIELSSEREKLGKSFRFL